MPTKKELLEENDELIEKLENIRDEIDEVLDGNGETEENGETETED